MTDPIKAKIIEQCPDVISEHSVQCDMDTSRGYITPHEELGCEVRDITLAVILRAINLGDHDSLVAVGEYGSFYIDDLQGDGYGICDESWNLEKDRWEDQTKETQLLIGSLLGVV